MIIRSYNPQQDYEAIVLLYKNSSTYGGQFDADRDSENRLRKLVQEKPKSILVVEEENEVIGTISLFEDGRNAWLFRFAVKEEHEKVATKELFKEAKRILKERGHKQVLVFAPTNNEKFEHRYKELSFTKGGKYTCFWQDFS